MTDTTITEPPADITLPDDDGRSRIRRPAEQRDDDNDIVRAADRFKRFRTRYKEGHHDASLERVIEHADGELTYIVRAKVWKVWPSFGGEPDATAWAQASTKDANPIVAASPLESADTIARSRALRNLGILPDPVKGKS